MIDNPRMLQCKTTVSTTRRTASRRRHRGLVVILGTSLALAALAGCGQKGPLKLPSSAAPASAASAP